MHTLPDGQRLEVLHLPATGAPAATASTPRPAIVFLHGSYHAAWCWREHFLPFFSAAGYDCYALSMRCQGGSDRAPGLKVAGTIDALAADIGSFVGALPRPPVLVAHSFAGLICQK